VRAAGGVCIADEVQVGFGRVGAPHFWAFQLAGADVVPDIVTLGKPIGNGFPVAAVVTTPAIARAFSAEMDYFNTFAGNAVAAAAALAVLDVIEAEALPEAAARVGAVLLDGLRALAARYDGVRCPRGPVVGSVRGAGLMLGVELLDAGAPADARKPDADSARAIKYGMLARRVLISSDGMHDNILKIKPPMCLTEQNARDALAALEACFAARAAELAA